MLQKNAKAALLIILTLILSSFSAAITPAHAADDQSTQTISAKGTIIAKNNNFADNVNSNVYQNSLLLRISGISVFQSRFSNGFPDPGTPYTDSATVTANGIEFNGKYASFWQKPYDSSSPTISSYTKIITLNTQNLNSFQNFFWIIGNDLDSNQFGLRINPSGEVQYMLNSGLVPISGQIVATKDLKTIAVGAYFNSTSSSFWGVAAVSYNNGASMTFTPIQLSYQPNFQEYKIYVDKMEGNFEVFNTMQTNATVADFFSTVLPSLDQFQIVKSAQQNLSNSLSADVASAALGWSGYADMNYWSYDNTTYLSQPRSGKIFFTTQTADDAMWTSPINMDQTKRWTHFGAWIFINGSGSARMGIDFRNSGFTIVKDATSYSLLTPNKWAYVEMWALAPANAVFATPWVQYNQGSSGQYVLFDDASLSFAATPTPNLSLQVSGNVQVSIEQVLLAKDWFSLTA
jgi:hypothetical protein